MRVNQIGITIYDNKPNLPANKWYETTDVKDDVTNRYKLEMNFLHKGSAIKLRSSLYWPPNQLRRLSYWDNHSDFYESAVNECHNINRQIRNGEINARVPALLAIPNMNESFTTRDKRKHFKWRMPDKPSVVIAVRQYVNSEHYQWHLQWRAKDFEQTFIIDHKCTAEDIAGRKGPALRVSRGFLGPHIIDDSLLNGNPNQITYMKTPVKIDHEYNIFKQRIQELMLIDSPLNRNSINELCKKQPEFEQRYLKELE